MTDHYSDGTYRWWHLSHPSPELRQAVADRWLPECGRAIDIGCGLGTEAAYLHQAGWRVVGIDLVPAALTGATARNPGPSYLLADLLRLPVRPAVFDAALDRGCFQYLAPSDRGGYASQVRRALRPGGKLLLRASLRSAGVRNDIDESVIRSTFSDWTIEHMERAQIPSDTRSLDMLLVRLTMWPTTSTTLALLSGPGGADHGQVTHLTQVARTRPVYGAALALALGPAAALGLARFGYALLLAPMRTSLHWSFAIAGALSTANSAGYLVGAMLAGPLTRRWGTRKAFVLGTGLSAVALLATAATGGSLMLFGLRTVVGVSGAVSFIAGAALVAQVIPPGSVRRAAALLSIYTAGIGAGIVISGAGVPWLLAAVQSPAGWRFGWLVFGGLAAVACVIAVPAALSCDERPVSAGPGRRWPVARLGPLLACYVLFGVGYIGYFTFIVAYLQGRGASPGFITAFWILLGAASVAGGFGWAPVIGRLRGGRAPSVIMAVVCVGALPPLLSRSVIAAIASAVLFGSSVVASVAAVMAVARRSLEPVHWAPAITWLTVGFAAGQCLGPLLAGLLADRPAGLAAGLYLSAGVLAIGSAVALTQRHIDANLTSDVPAARTLAPAEEGARS